MKVKILRLFSNITRVDEETRTVEGYAFVNPDCGDGMVLPRATMERMTADYLKWANVREMHGAKAVGTCSVDWDDTGAFMRAEIVDDDAWEKVKKGVYKAFSVGVKPTKVKRLSVNRAEVTDGTWFETSLVDRPKDPDSAFSIARADDAVADEAVEVEVDEEANELPAEPATRGIMRGYLMAKLQSAEPATLVSKALCELDSFCYSIKYGGSYSGLPEGTSLRTAFIEAMNDVRDYVSPFLDQIQATTRADGETQPLSLLQAYDFATRAADYDQVIERAHAAETRIAAADTELVELRAQIEAFNSEADPTQTKPVKGLSEEAILDLAKGITEKRAAAQQEKPEQTPIGDVDWANASEEEKRTAFLAYNRAKAGG